MERLAQAGKTASVSSVRSIAESEGVDERDLTTLARALALIDDVVFADVAETFLHDIFLMESPSGACDRIVVRLWRGVFATLFETSSTLFVTSTTFLETSTSLIVTSATL